MERGGLLRRAVMSALIGAGIAVLTADVVASEVRRPHGPVSMDDRWRVGSVGAVTFLVVTVVAFVVMTAHARYRARVTASIR